MALVLAGMLAACGDSKPASKPAPGKPAAPASGAAPTAAAPAAGSTAEGEKPAAEAKPPGYVYSSVGKRDPFRSFISELGTSGGTLVTRCNTALGRYELEQMQLVAVVTGLADPVAMVQTPGGTGFSIRRGSCIGKNGGTVSSIRTGEVLISEWVVKADGAREKTQTVLKLPKQTALNLEEQ
jgi:type IV pilus assembly protein PilP